MMVKDQSFKMKFKIMGFGFSGNFVNVFTDYMFDYDTQKTFDKYIQEYDKEALTHPSSYWDTMRPVPLETDEVIDYIKKDSIETAANAKKDTTNIKPEKNSVRSFVTKGYKRSLKNKQYVSTSPIISVKSLLNQVNWNTAEGVSYSYSVGYRKKINNDKAFTANLDMRYGFSNQQFNAKINTKYAVGKTNKSILRISGGRYVFQYNNYDPVIYAVLWQQLSEVISGVVRNYSLNAYMDQWIFIHRPIKLSRSDASCEQQFVFIQKK
jgi:hypothetical protein